jgi:uncharacterized protein YoxC
MSETVQVLLIVGGLLVGGFLLLVVGAVLWMAWKTLNKLQKSIEKLADQNEGMEETIGAVLNQLAVLANTSKDLQQFPESLKVVSAEIKEAATGLTELPKYVEGHQKVGVALVAEVIQFRKLVAAFSTLLMNGGTKEPMLTTYDDSQMAKEIDIQDLISKSGFSREEAEGVVMDTLGVD